MPFRSHVPAALGAAAAIAVATPPTAAQVPPPDFQRQLQERDAVIADLMRRVETLERQLAGPRAPAPDRGAAPATRPPTVGTQPPSPADEDESVARALERTLVTQGGLLLSRGTYEIAPLFQYRNTSVDQLGIIGNTVTGVTTRRDTIDAGFIFRAGLPFASQFDIRIPFVADWTDTSFLGQTVSRTDKGLGDIDIGLSKQILYERGWVPDLIGSLRWKTSTGDADFAAGGRLGGTGTGFDSVSAALTAVKRQDPLVFLGSLSYTYVLEDDKNGIEFAPGDSVGVRIGTILAASPETSLRFVLDTSFDQEDKVGGVTIAGSDRVASLLEIGASSILTSSLLLDLGLGIGLTPSAPNFIVSLSLPYRF